MDPSTVKLVGNVHRPASDRGAVWHRVGRAAAAPLPAAEARLVVAPAEVEIG